MTQQETADRIAWLTRKAYQVRRDVLLSLSEAGSGHTGGSLGLADLFTALYFHQMSYRAQDPMWEGRDRLILSIGHVAPVLYATLAHAGFFPVEELLSLRKLGSRLQGHPGRDHGLPGLELSAGSLGQGLSVGVGMALGASLRGMSHKVIVVCGDGELQEGSVWEAAMSAAHHKLKHLIVVVDRNKLQIDGSTEAVMGLEPLEEKWNAFGWRTVVCDGNDFHSLLPAISTCWTADGRPTCLIAETVMGKGVPFIENNHLWHGKPPNGEELVQCLNELY
jgi:transketolase